MKIKSKRLLNNAKRIIAISDIHGNRHLLERLLAKCEYQPQKDHLIILGDMIEKGPDSLGTLHLVMDLWEQGNVDVLMGNCDAIPLQIMDGIDLYGLCHYLQHAPWKKHMLLWEMADLIGVDLSLTKDYQASFQQILKAFPKEFSFLSSLIHVLVDEHMLFVHAGLEKVTAPYASDAYKIMKFDNFALQYGYYDKMIVCGHTPVINYCNFIPCANPWYCENNHVLSIDGGCGINPEGQLNAVIFEDGSFHSLYVDDLPQGIILADYDSHQDTAISISWRNRQIEKRKELEDAILCYHIASKKEILIPKDRIYEERGQCCTKNFSDHQLTVRKNDQVGIVNGWKDKVYVKLNGIYGWVPKRIVKRMDVDI